MPLDHPLLWTVVVASHLVGAGTAVAALMSTRTAQGTVAWILALITFPYLSVPLFWVLGRRRFEGYLVARRDEGSRLREVLETKLREMEPWHLEVEDEGGGIRALETLARLPLTSGNEVELLIDGEEIFRSFFQGISRAREYVLVQFYIVRDDGVGRRLQQRLVEKAAEGVRVLFLYDQIGSYRLPRSYLEALRDGGVEVRPFRSTRAPGSRFQVNFRNHRKVLVVDGRDGWVGGINVGDEYLGKDPDLGPMRETHLRVRGPAVAALQLSFLEDWKWASGDVPELRWNPDPAPEDRAVLILPSGPADEMETGSLLVQHAVHSAQDRIWISTPYFVPDGGVMSSLRLAALRGVDVRILVPDRADHRVVGLASFPFIADLLAAGVRFFRYQPGFLHAKALLLDDTASAVGTLNLDNRSFRLNFEITALTLSAPFAREVEAMFLADFQDSREMTVEEVLNRSFLRRAVSKVAALFAPIL